MYEPEYPDWLTDAQPGTLVKVRTLTGEGERVLAGFTDEWGPLFCSIVEWRKSREEGRKPSGIGWPADCIIGPA